MFALQNQISAQHKAVDYNRDRTVVRNALAPATHPEPSSYPKSAREKINFCAMPQIATKCERSAQFYPQISRDLAE